MDVKGQTPKTQPSTIKIVALRNFANLRQSSSSSWPELSLIPSVSHPPITHPTGKVLPGQAECWYELEKA